MLLESHEFTVKIYRRLFICFVRCFRSLETTKIYRFFVSRYAGYPFLVSFAPRYTLEPGCVVASLFGVDGILYVGGGAKLSPSVVRSYPVPMINLKLWPLSCHIKPCQSMGHKPIFHYNDSDIPLLVQGPSYFSGQPSARCRTYVHSFAPSKYAREGVIIQNRLYVINGQPLAGIIVFRNILCSHLTLLRSFWSGFAGGVGSALRNPNYAVSCGGGQD